MQVTSEDIRVIASANSRTKARSMHRILLRLICVGQIYLCQRFTKKDSLLLLLLLLLLLMPTTPILFLLLRSETVTVNAPLRAIGHNHLRLSLSLPPDPSPFLDTSLKLLCLNKHRHTLRVAPTRSIRRNSFVDVTMMFRLVEGQSAMNHTGARSYTETNVVSDLSFRMGQTVY